MNPIFVAGIGAVSPAGWNVDAMRDALAKGDPLPARSLTHPSFPQPLQTRVVPPRAVRPGFLGHGRLRRASPISQFAVSAALEALEEDAQLVSAGALKLGIVFSVMAGCVTYSRRFYEETLRDPVTASPLIFPETVFNAPASHLASLLGSTAVSYTLVGDPGMFLAGLALAADWLVEGRVAAALVVSAEESDWLVTLASRHFQKSIILSEGAGAIYLKAASSDRSAVQLGAITDAQSFGQTRHRALAAQAMRAQLPAGAPGHLLCDGLVGVPHADAAERAAWSDWTQGRLSPKRVLGDGMAASSGWQCVAAVDALSRQQRPGVAHVSVVGCNQQAIGATFVTGPSLAGTP